MDKIVSYFNRMRRLLRRRGRSQEDAEDLIQEAFLRMQAYCEQGGQVREPEAFLVRTVQRLAINAYRDEHRSLYSPDRVEDLILIDSQPPPDEVLAAEQCLQRMNRRLQHASPRTRDIFLMHRLEGHSYAQIAAHLSISVSAVEKHVASAIAMLADEMRRE